ncbi:NisI/SpaI family lantibiotic immunity lipoprotein [Lactococcus lactis]|uniref:Immunity protein n=1 Tax=Lactococcus lactis TaxID=1358 RepID=B5MEU0_9LACT|nr:NisI/SpaI family lantibiotic immunity lipoprotein [Lactococcus lactis]BAG71483.1 immunity protein [Lactococcus lactis]
MKKYLLLIVALLGMTSLAGCYQTSQKEVRFEKGSYKNFVYDNKSYFVTDKQISQGSVNNSKAKFYKLLIVDAKSEKVLSSSNKNSVTLAFNNIYQTSDKSLCMGVNDKYYQVLPESNEGTVKALSLQNFDQTGDNSDDNFSIDKNDARKIDYKGNIYSVSDKSVPDDELGEFQDVLAEVRVFDSTTGKTIPKSDWGKIDNGESISKQNRTEWDYGEIHSIKGKAMTETFAIEINDDFKLATKAGN